MPISESGRKARANYNKKCDFIAIQPLVEVGADIRAAAAASGSSLQAFVLEAIYARMHSESHPLAGDWTQYAKPLLPYKIVASFTDGARLYFSGITEAEAISRMEAAQEAHGSISWYDSVTDIDYDRGTFHELITQPIELPIIDLTDDGAESI